MPAKPSVNEPRRRARRRALQALYQWRLNPGEPGALLRQFRQAQDFGNVDGELFERLVRGVIDSSGQLQASLGPFLDRDFEALDLVEQVILQLGAWELQHHPELPFQVIVSEAVDLAHRFGAEQGHGYINAVLDKAARQWRSVEPDVAQGATPVDGL